MPVCVLRASAHGLPVRSETRWSISLSLPLSGPLRLTIATATPRVFGESAAAVARLPDGKRRSALSEAIDRFVADDLQGLVLAFGSACAAAYGLIVAARERAGRPIGIADAQIAATCSVHDAVLATRNTKDFQGTAIALINPWDPPTTKP